MARVSNRIGSAKRDEHRLLRLIEKIYSAPTNPDGWRPVLDALMRDVGGGWGQIHVADFWSQSPPRAL